MFFNLFTYLLICKNYEHSSKTNSEQKINIYAYKHVYVVFICYSAAAFNCHPAPGPQDVNKLID